MHPSPPSDSGKKQTGSGEQMVRAARQRERSEPAETACPRSQPHDLLTPAPTKIYRGSCRSLGLCIPAALFIGKYSKWKPDSTSKNSRIYSNSTRSPAVEVCDNSEQIPRLISKRQHVKPKGENAQTSSSGPR